MLGAQARELGLALGELFLGRLGGLHLFEDFGLQLGDVLPGGVALADGRLVDLGVVRGHQVALGLLHARALLGQVAVERDAGLARGLARLLEHLKFKSALIELAFDLGAPSGD
ncbi:MAG: hypothetical protein LC795_11400 [Acidobacteria bacterium]|nr:hypothetical protein [Acidobacteriota bacterium]MCA1619896.1 hypothetical protein [Acidobacteriota bacterium]